MGYHISRVWRAVRDVCDITWQYITWPSTGGTPPVWLLLFIFTAASNFTLEQALLHFYLILSTGLFCRPALALRESVISFHTFAFSAFIMTFVCFDLIIVIFFSTSWHKKIKSALEKCSPLRLFLLSRWFLTFILQRILWNHCILFTG